MGSWPPRYTGPASWRTTLPAPLILHCRNLKRDPSFQAPTWASPLLLSVNIISNIRDKTTILQKLFHLPASQPKLFYKNVPYLGKFLSFSFSSRWESFSFSFPSIILVSILQYSQPLNLSKSYSTNDPSSPLYYETLPLNLLLPPINISRHPKFSWWLCALLETAL